MLESSRPPSAAGTATCSRPASGRQNVPRGTMPSPAIVYIFMLNLHFNLHIHTLVCIFIHVPPLRPHWGVFVTSCRFRGKKAQIGRSSRMVALPPCSKAPDPPVQQGRQRVSEAGENPTLFVPNRWYIKSLGKSWENSMLKGSAAAGRWVEA